MSLNTIVHIILEKIEPKDVYEQSYLPVSKRSFRMKLATLWWFIVARHFD